MTSMSSRKGRGSDGGVLQKAVFREKVSITRPMTEGQTLFLILTMNTSYHRLVAALAKHVGLVSVLGLIALSTGCGVTRSLSTGCMMTLVCTGCATMAIPHKKTHGDMTVLSKRIVMSLVLTADVVKKISTDRIRLHTPATYRFKAKSIPNTI